MINLGTSFDRLYVWTITRIASLWIRPTALPVNRVASLRGRGR
jgi:hypothetical protein